MRWRPFWVCIFFFVLCHIGVTFAAPDGGVHVHLGEGITTSRLLQIFIGIGVLAIAPGLLIMTTAFTRIVVVLSFLRHALGLQQSPPNIVLIALSLFLTFFVMSPVWQQSYDEGLRPLMEEKISETDAAEKIGRPLHGFMIKQVREKDLKLFADLGHVPTMETPDETPWRVLLPAFLLSELRKAFEVGFLIFLPFLVIDLVVSSVLMAMGMMMLPPTMIALPVKIAFFVLIDGWHLLSEALVGGFLR